MSGARLRVGVFHPAAQHSWQTALAFQEADQLAWYATGVFYDPAKWPYAIERLVPPVWRGRVHSRLTRRFTPDLDPARIRQLGIWEWLGTGADALGHAGLAAVARQRAAAEFARKVIALIEREPVDVLIGYDTAALAVFRWAKQHGIRCVLERTIGHSAAQNRVLSEEYRRHPEFWTSPFMAKSQAVLDAEQEEIDLADRVIVGAHSVRDTLIAAGCAPDKIAVVGYGFDERRFPAARPVRPPAGDRPVRFLFVGGLHPRKGLAYLLPAFARVPPRAARLTLVGPMALNRQTFARYADRVTYVPTVPRAAVMQYFAAADCFVFPSLFEGSAIVLREIYGAGLGAIHSRASGSGVTDGENGIVLDSVSVEAVEQAIGRVLDDPACLERWQQNSWDRRGGETWALYRQALRGAIGQCRA